MLSKPIRPQAALASSAALSANRVSKRDRIRAVSQDGKRPVKLECGHRPT